MSFEKEFVATWKIDNFLYCIEKKGEDIKSPSFISFAGSKWHLCLYPRGHDPENTTDISFYLYREKSEDGLKTMVMDFELAIIRVDGTVDSTVNIANHPFDDDCCCGVEAFISRRDVVEKNSAEFLAQDGALNVRCTLRWKNSGDATLKNGSCSISTHIAIERGAFEWSLQDFSSLKTGQVKILVVEPTSCKFIPLKIKAFLSGGYVEDRNIKIETSSVGFGASMYCFMKFFVLSSHGIILDIMEDEFWFDEGRMQSWKFPVFLTRNRILEKKNLYLAKDTLKLKGECVFSIGVEASDIEYAVDPVDLSADDDGSKDSDDDLQERSEETKENATTSRAEDGVNFEMAYRSHSSKRKYPKGCNYGEVSQSFRTNMLGMYEDQVLSDFQLRAGAQIFRVNKALLSVRSPVFMAMFTSGMEEETSSLLDVVDLDAETMHMLLVFLYSDIVEDLDWKKAMKLFYAADKYQVHILRQMITEYIMANFTPENVLEAIVLEDMHPDQRLKNAALEFALNNDFRIIGSEAWTSFENEHDGLAYETLKSLYLMKLAVLHGKT